MRDWQQFTRERLETCPLPAAERDEVIRELAAHLEEGYAQACLEGLSDDEAFKVAQQEIPQGESWQVLAADICRAKQENSMNIRTKTVWLPGIAILFAAGLGLIFLDRAAYLQRFIWIACMAMLFGAADSEKNRLSQRTRSFWLPGFVSMTAAAIFLFAADIAYEPFLFFREITLHPQDLLRMNTDSLRASYLVWLGAQVVFGALGALFSRRAGGTRTSRIAAGSFPAVIIVGTYVVLMPVTSMFSGQAATSPLPAYLTAALLVWVAAPAVAVLLGAAPFIRESNKSRIAESC